MLNPLTVCTENTHKRIISVRTWRGPSLNVGLPSLFRSYYETSKLEVTSFMSGDLLWFCYVAQTEVHVLTSSREHKVDIQKIFKSKCHIRNIE